MAVLDRVPAAESKQLDLMLRPHEQAAQYLAENYDDLVARYRSQWIAICDSKVIAHSRAKADLRKQLEGRQAAEPVYVTFLTGKEQTLIL